MNESKRWGLIAVAIGVMAAIGALSFGLHITARTLKSKVEQALGPNSEIAAMHVGWSSLEIDGLRVKAPPGWPTVDALRAQRIVIVPDLRALLSSKIIVRRITVDGAYISILRGRDGHLHLLPRLIEPHGGLTVPGQTMPTATLGAVLLRDSALEFFDATVRHPPHKLRIEQLMAEIDNLNIPDLVERSTIKLDGIVKGAQHDGTLSIRGWAEAASKNCSLSVQIKDVDVKVFEPYLIKVSETGVRRGILGLDLKSMVHNNRLTASGDLTLSGLELESKNVFGTFMGVPQRAVVAALKNEKGQIEIHFTLAGNFNDPRFSLNENFAMQLETELAKTLGINLEALAHGVGNAARGIDSGIVKLFGH